MSLRDDLLPALDDIRGIPDELGLRGYAVSVVVRTWSDTNIGDGTKTDVVTALRSAAGRQTVKVRQLTQKEVIASGGLYQSQDLEVGPLTPSYAGGGISPATFDPAVSSSPLELLFLVTGTGLPTAGAYYRKVGEDVSSSLHYTLTIRKTGEVA